jgi:hypothetical protein
MVLSEFSEEPFERVNADEDRTFVGHALAHCRSGRQNRESIVAATDSQGTGGHRGNLGWDLGFLQFVPALGHHQLICIEVAFLAVTLEMESLLQEVLHHDIHLSAGRSRRDVRHDVEEWLAVFFFNPVGPNQLIRFNLK